MLPVIATGIFCRNGHCGCESIAHRMVVIWLLRVFSAERGFPTTRRRKQFGVVGIGRKIDEVGEITGESSPTFLRQSYCILPLLELGGGGAVWGSHFTS